MTDSRVPRRRRYLVCEPRHFAVQYAINPWMHPDTPVDVDLAQDQWQELIRAYRTHGHSVETVEPVAELPDMVFAANCALVLGGRVFRSLFHAPEPPPVAGGACRLSPGEKVPGGPPSVRAPEHGARGPAAGLPPAGAAPRGCTGADCRQRRNRARQPRLLFPPRGGADRGHLHHGAAVIR